MIYTLTLNPALDYDIYTNGFEISELNLSKEINYRAGGKGINVSIMLKNLGENSIALGFVAGFTGEYITKSLDERQIKSDFVSLEGLTRINVKINDGKNETEIAGISPKISLQKLEELLEKIKMLCEEDILVLSGSVPSSLEKDIYRKISEKTNAKIVLDTRGNLLLENIHNNILIKPNIKELEEVVGEKLDTNEKIIKACNIFLEKGVQNVLVSMGSKGAMLVNKEKVVMVKSPKGSLINSIGAGDSTVAGFITGYINNLTDEKKACLAVACGSATAYSYGIGSKESVDKLLKEIEYEVII